MSALSLPSELQEIFSNPQLLERFKNFSALSFCEENVYYLEEVIQFRAQNPSKPQAADILDRIVTKYVRTDSPLSINVDYPVRKLILDKAAQKPFDPALFDESFAMIASMIHRDTLPKFKPIIKGSTEGSNNSYYRRATLRESSRDSYEDEEITQQSWYRGHLLRRKGFFGQWKPFTYTKKGQWLFEFKPGANHVTSEPLESINLENCLVEPAKVITGRANTFVLNTQDGHGMFFQASSKEEMDEWIEELSYFSVSLRRGSRAKRSSVYSDHSTGSLDYPSHDSLSPSTSSMNTMLSLVATATVTTSSSGSSSNSSSTPSSPPLLASSVILSNPELAKQLPILNFMESFSDAVVIGDSKGVIVAMNSAAERMFGFTKPGGAAGQPLTCLMPEPYATLHDGYLFKHEKYGQERLIGKTRNLKGIKRTGESFDIQISLGKLPLKGYFIATIRDETCESFKESTSTGKLPTTTEELPEPVILEGEELYRQLPILKFLESFTDAVVVGDSRGSIVAVNSSAEKMFGFTKPGEAVGQPLTCLMPEPYATLHDGYLFKHEKYGQEKLIGKTRNLKGIKRTGESFDLQISLGKLPIKGYFIATIRNDAGDSSKEPSGKPTKVDLSEPVILEGNELYQQLPILNFLESFTDSVVVGDSRGLIVAVNSAAEKMFGFTKPGDANGKSLSCLMPEPYSSLHDGYLFKHEKKGQEKLIGKTRNLKGVKRNGEVFDLQISLGKLPVKGYFIATIRDAWL